LEIDGNSIFLKANARILGWMDGWMDGWWMMDTTVMFLMVGFTSELCCHKPIAGFLPKDG
jgi:hypothetical protein